MTLDERATALCAHGFTPRQAAFLTTVMLHAGVCVQRQYRTFARIAHGQVVRDFFEKLVSRRFARPYVMGREGTHMYHVQHKALYRAIGEPDSRFRKRGTVVRAMERLMVLDAVLSARQFRWLATEREKVAYFIHERGLPTGILPALTFESGALRTTRYFPEKLPIALGSAGEVTLLFVVTERTGQVFRGFLQRHEELVRRLSQWRVLVVVPRSLAMATETHQGVVREFCAAPLRPAIVDEFKWYCTTRRKVDDGAQEAITDRERYSRARRTFGSPRFYAAYLRWRDEGDSSLGRLVSPTLHDAWERGAVRMDVLTLDHMYGEAGPLAQTA